MELWIIWLIVAGLLLIVEVLSQMVWALCLTVGSLVALVCCLSGLPPLWQIVAMGASAIVTYAAVLPYFRRWQQRRSHHQARTGMDALLGRRAAVIEPILPGSLGRARIDGDNWQVKAPGVQSVISAGCEVVVVAYDSIILTVEPVVE